MLIRLKTVLKWSLLKLRFFHPLLSFPWIHTQQWYFVFSVCYYWSPAKIAKNACVPEWSRLDKYHPSTFRVRQSDMCSLCHRHERAECSNMMSLSHINQPLWHFYTPLSLFKKFSSWPLYTNMVTKTYGLTAGELFFGLIVNWIVIHYPLCVNASPLSRCLITYLSVSHPLVTSRRLENITAVWPVCEKVCVLWSQIMLWECYDWNSS